MRWEDICEWRIYLWIKDMYITRGDKYGWKRWM